MSYFRLYGWGQKTYVLVLCNSIHLLILILKINVDNRVLQFLPHLPEMQMKEGKIKQNRIATNSAVVFLYNEKISGMNVLDNNWMSLENSCRLRAELLSSKGQCNLHRGGQAWISFHVKHFSFSSEQKGNELGCNYPKSQSVTISKHRATEMFHHRLPYAANYIKYRLWNAYTPVYSSRLKCPFTSQDLFSSPVPVNYTKWGIRHWFYKSMVVASNPIITCLLVQ